MYKLGKIIRSCLAYIVAGIIIVMGLIGMMFITPAALITRYNDKKQSETESENTENVSNNENEEES